jgi:hypothetical protein
VVQEYCQNDTVLVVAPVVVHLGLLPRLVHHSVVVEVASLNPNGGPQDLARFHYLVDFHMMQVLRVEMWAG